MPKRHPLLFDPQFLPTLRKNTAEKKVMKMFGEEEANVAVETVEAPAEVIETPVATDEGADGESHLSDRDLLDQEEKPAETDEGAAAEEAKPGEEAKPAPADEAKPAEAKPEDKPAPVEEPRAVKALREAIDKDPGIKAALEKNPTFRNRLYADARRSEELALYKPHFATPELAKAAVQDVQALMDLESLLGSPEPDAPQKLLSNILERSIQRDAAGNPLKDPKTGMYVTDGSYDRLVTGYRKEALWPYIEQTATKLAKEDPEFDSEPVIEALNTIKAFLGDGASAEKPKAKSAEGAVDEETLPPETRRLLEQGRTADLQQRNAESKAEGEYRAAVTTSVKEGCLSAISERVETAGKALSPNIRKRIRDDAYAQISKIAKADPIYQRTISSIYRRSNRGEDAKQEMTALAKTYTKERMNTVIAALVKEFSEGAITANQEKHDKLTKQTERREPQSAGGVPEPSRPDVHSMVAEGEKLMRQLEGRSLKEGEILSIEDILPNLRNKAAARAKR